MIGVMQRLLVYRESISCGEGIHGDRHVVVDHYAVCYSKPYPAWSENVRYLKTMRLRIFVLKKLP